MEAADPQDPNATVNSSDAFRPDCRHRSERDEDRVICDKPGMSKTVIGVGVLILVAGGALWLGQRADNAVLRREFGLLRQEVRQMAERKISEPFATITPAPENPAARDNTTELAALRAEIVALRKTTQEMVGTVQTAVTQAQADHKQVDPAVRAALVPASAWKNAGRGTPSATAETVLWAALAGDVDTLAGALTMSPEVRAKAEAWLAGMGEGARQQYGTPEKVLALLIAKDAATLSGMQVLGQKELGPDETGVRVRFASADGKLKENDFRMLRFGDGWRVALPDAAVEKLAKQLSGRR